MFKSHLLCLLKLLFVTVNVACSVYLLFSKEFFSQHMATEYREFFKYLQNVFHLHQYPWFFDPEFVQLHKDLVFDISVYSNFTLLFLALFLSRKFFFVYGLKYLLVTLICSRFLPLDFNNKEQIKKIGQSVFMYGISCLLSSLNCESKC